MCFIYFLNFYLFCSIVYDLVVRFDFLQYEDEVLIDLDKIVFDEIIFVSLMCYLMRSK